MPTITPQNQMISVIIPAYNMEAYLEDCLRSVLNQTYKNTEIILVDDGSTDQTGTICDKFAQEYINIKVLHQDNKGLSGARNAGLKLASGQWISFVDSDDLLHPQMYEFLIKTLGITDSKMAFCNFKFFQYQERPSFEDYDFHEADIETISIEEEFRKILKRQYYTTVWRGIYDCETIRNIPFVEGMIFEDIIWSFQTRGTQESIVNIPYELYYYRLTPGSLARQSFNLGKFDRLKSLEMAISYVEHRAPAVLSGIKIDACTPVINYQFQIWDVKDRNERKEYQKLLNHYRKEFRLSTKELLTCKDARNSRKMFVLLANVSFPAACLLKKWAIRVYEFIKSKNTK